MLSDILPTKNMPNETHVLKCDSEPFNAVRTGIKLFELRKNDRPYKIGDMVSLHETRYTGSEMHNGKPLDYTGRVIQARIVYMLADTSYGIEDGYVILGFSSVTIMEANHKQVLTLTETYNQWAIG